MVTTRKYGIYAETEKGFTEAAEAMRAALKARGFGILWEIDARATLKEKLGVEFPDYLILGACNPPIAHQALTMEPDIGLLLPCNCIVRREGGKVVLGAIEPGVMMSLTGREELRPLAEQVEAILRDAVAEAAN